jgi:PRTRC genetic system protein C
MPIKITTPVRIFRHNGIDYADPAPSATVERAVELLSTVNTELMNSIIDPGSPEEGKIVYSLKTAVGTKGGDVCNGEDAAYACETSYGLTKRELFAAMAMQALINDDGGISYAEAAQHAVKHARELIKALNAE